MVRLGSPFGQFPLGRALGLDVAAVTVPRVQRRQPAKPLEWYRSKGKEGMALAYLSGDYTMKAIADHFGVHYATVSWAVKAWDAGECSNTAALDNPQKPRGKDLLRAGELQHPRSGAATD